MNNSVKTTKTHLAAEMRRTIRTRRRRAAQAACTAAALSGLAFLAVGGGNLRPSSASALSASTRAGGTVCTDLTGGAKVACYANKFYSSSGLTPAQQGTLQLPFTATNAVNWSNLPVSFYASAGLPIGTLTPTQQTAFLNVVKAALGATAYNGSTDPGYYTYDAIRKADDYLSANGGGATYGSGQYHMAFLGSPSTSAVWELQLTGHHNDWNLVYNNGTVTATPNFLGVEPQTFTANGTPYEPLSSRRDAMYGIVSSLTAPQLASATLSQSFSDVLLGPGQDGMFPAQQGLPVSSMTAAQQQMVKAVIEQWVGALPAGQAKALLSSYESSASLANTYVAISGARTPTAQGSYVRIDGPRVWIEFVCQNGIVFPGEIHFHTIWRDKAGDYGGQFSSYPASGMGTGPGGGTGTGPGGGTGTGPGTGGGTGPGTGGGTPPGG